MERLSTRYRTRVSLVTQRSFYSSWMRFALVSVVLAALLGLTSCGGSDEPLTASEYLASGNELCGEWSNEIAQIAPPANASEEDIFDFTTEAGRIADEYTERLMDLSPPASLATDRADLQERLDEFDILTTNLPQTEQEFDEITEAGDAISDALGNIWSSCRGR